MAAGVRLPAPACDLAIAWTLFTEDSRQAFRERLSVDPATWARGRGWALWKALVTCARSADEPEDLATALRVLEDLHRVHDVQVTARPR